MCVFFFLFMIKLLSGNRSDAKFILFGSRRGEIFIESIPCRPALTKVQGERRASSHTSLSVRVTSCVRSHVPGKAGSRQGYQSLIVYAQNLREHNRDLHFRCHIWKLAAMLSCRHETRVMASASFVEVNKSRQLT